MFKKYYFYSIITLLLFTQNILSKIPTTGVRVSNFVQQLVQQDADFLIAQNDIPKTISTPGVYKLAESVTIGTGVTGFTISADDVTLDLNGKKVSGGATGISISTNQNNVTVQNGLISGCTSTGVAAASGDTNITLQDLQIRSIGTGLAGIGISLAGVSNSVIRRCLVTATAGTGLNATSNCQRLSIEDSSFNNSSVNGAVINQCSSSLINRCIFSTNTQEGLLITNGSQNIVVDSCSALDNTNNGFSLVSSNTILLKECQSMNNARSTNIAGFSAQNGYGNIFEECVANGMVTTSTNADEFAAGFLFVGTEQCSKIINSEVGNITTPVGGNSIPYGIYLQATLDNTNTVTIATNSLNDNTVINAAVSIKWSPNGLFLAAGTGSFALSSNDGALILLEYIPTTNVLVKRFSSEKIGVTGSNTTPNVLSIDWSPNGNYIAMGGGELNWNFNISEFDSVNKIFTSRVSVSLTGTSVFAVRSVNWSPDGKFIAVGGENLNNDISIYEFDPIANTVALVRTAFHGADVFSVKWSPNGAFLAMGGDTNGFQLRLFEFDPSSKILTQRDTQTPGAIVYSVAWSFDGNFLAASTASQAGSEIFIYQFNSSTKLLTLVSSVGVGSDVYSVDWSPDGKFLVSGTAGSNISIYPFNRNTRTLGTPTTVAHGAAVFSTHWSPDGRRIAANGNSAIDRVVAALKFPTQNTVVNNKTYCITGNQYLTGIGTAGSTIDNFIAQNISYRNDFNYQFVTSTYTNGISGNASSIQNIALPPF